MDAEKRNGADCTHTAHHLWQLRHEFREKLQENVHGWHNLIPILSNLPNYRITDSSRSPCSISPPLSDLLRINLPLPFSTRPGDKQGDNQADGNEWIGRVWGLIGVHRRELSM